MKKFAIAGAAAALLAIPAAANAEAFKGPFIGAQISRDAYEVKAEGTEIADGVNVSFDGLSANGIGGGLYAGYDFAFGSNVFFGVEANGNISSASISASATDGTDTIGLFKVKAKESFGLSGRLGGMVTGNTGLYARLGWQSTKFKASSDLLGVSGSSTQDAFVYGAGLETRLSPAASLRVEYLVEDYGSAGLNSDLGVSGIRVDNNKLNVGLSYRF